MIIIDNLAKIKRWRHQYNYGLHRTLYLIQYASGHFCIVMNIDWHIIVSL